jgi:16S rRNA U516 pseudouridylate synthase RsuA-like enzyme
MSELPIRINKYLAIHKYSTRRGADELIKAGKVKINGKKALLGDKVAENDKVEVDAKTISNLKRTTFICL